MSLKQRLTKLEQTCRPGKPLVVCLRSFGRHPVTTDGFRGAVVGGHNRPIYRAEYPDDAAFWSAVNDEHIAVYGTPMTRMARASRPDFETSR
jgi:hypothetical protein